MTERATGMHERAGIAPKATVNTSISLILRVGLSCSTLAATVSVFAGPLLIQDHNANGTPNHDAVMRCIKSFEHTSMGAILEEDRLRGTA